MGRAARICLLARRILLITDLAFYGVKLALILALMPFWLLKVQIFYLIRAWIVRRAFSSSASVLPPELKKELASELWSSLLRVSPAQLFRLALISRRRCSRSRSTPVTRRRKSPLVRVCRLRTTLKF